MQHVHALQVDQDVFVDRDVQIIDGVDVVARAELAVLARVAQPPLELPPGYFHRGRHVRLANLHVGPGVHLIDGDEQQRGRRQNRPDDFQVVAAVHVFHGIGVLGTVIAPQEPKQQHLGGDEHQPGEDQDERPQVVDLVTVLRDVLRQPIAGAWRPPKEADAEDRHHQKQQAPKLSHRRPPTSVNVLFVGQGAGFNFLETQRDWFSSGLFAALVPYG